MATACAAEHHSPLEKTLAGPAAGHGGAEDTRSTPGLLCVTTMGLSLWVSRLLAVANFFFLVLHCVGISLIPEREKSGVS